MGSSILPPPSPPSPVTIMAVEAPTQQNADLILANPFRCRMWNHHDRLDEYITEESCRLEIESFQRTGQLAPVLGRRIRGDSQYDYELIYGARRLFVARHLNKPIAMIIDALPDREAIAAMDIENRHRRDVSPYERGISYTRWLRQGLFSSQDDIARSLKISKSQVSRLIKLARLPTAVLKAFDSPLNISEAWGVALADAFEDVNRRAELLSNARALSRRMDALSSQEIYSHLIAPSQRATGSSASRRQVVRASSGEPLFHFKRYQQTHVISLSCRRVSPAKITQIHEAIAQILERESDIPR